MANKEQRTVFIFGAGASYSSKFELPTMRGFFGSNIQVIPENIRKFLEWFYPDKKSEEYNLEEILSYISLFETRVPIWFDSQIYCLATNKISMHEILQFVQSRLSIPTTESCDIHEKFLMKLGSQDSILTLNYDLIIDQTLRRLASAHTSEIHKILLDKLQALVGDPTYFGGRPPGLTQRETSGGYYIKLHGSLDWIYCPQKDCPNNRTIFCRGIEQLPVGQEPGIPCRICGSVLQICLMPPIATKRLADTGRIAFLWNIALRQLVCATTHTYFGVSLAPTDFELRWLIKQSLQLGGCPDQVIVINPDQSARRMVHTLYSDRCKITEYETVHSYLETRK
jgi:hypothetical protein